MATAAPLRTLEARGHGLRAVKGLPNHEWCQSQERTPTMTPANRSQRSSRTVKL